MANILGIDPGLNKTGFAIIEKNRDQFRIIKSGVITTSASDELSKRLKQIYTSLCEIIASTKIDLAGIEDTYVNNNYASSLKLAHARASAILAIANHNIPISEISAKTVKKTITGSGSADKQQVEKMINLMLSPPQATFNSHDESDAISISLGLALSLR